jgi:hypothetical protein
MYGFYEQYKSTDGFITITEASANKFKGSFSFQAKSFAGGTKTVTDGSFEITY